MPFDPDWLRYVPGPPDTDSPALRDVIGSARVGLEQSGRSDLFPVFVWSVLVGQENAQLGAINAAYPFVSRISFGFVDPDIDYGYADQPGLAVFIHISPPVSPDGYGGELEPLLARGGLLERRAIVVGPAIFPVVPRISIQEPQVALQYPASALPAAWMRIRRSTAPKEGWLLPFHAISRGIGLAVSYTDGSSGTVIDSLGSCMDAVVASSSNPPSSPGVQQRSADLALAAGLTVRVTDQNGNVVRALTLMDVDVNIGLLNYQKAPIRLTYDWSTSAPGDSGALVSNDATGAPVAMHQGTSWMREPSGAQLLDSNNNPVRRAFGICLFQVAHQFDGEFYL